jgi:hypothetical protein
VSTATFEAEIINGDSKGDLRAQLDDVGRYPRSVRKTFCIDIQEPELRNSTSRLYALIDGMVSLDGTGHLWLISGVYMPTGMNSYVGLTAKYNTQTRKGTFYLGGLRQ